MQTNQSTISQGLTQRESYKLVHRLLSGQFEDEFELLKSLVRHIVDRPEFTAKGGRIWELDGSDDAYVLRFQYGEMSPIPDGYKVFVAEQPVFLQLPTKGTIASVETNLLLQQSGIEQYAVTGVGEITKRPSGRVYHYACAFNADELNQPFLDTMLVVGSAASSVLRNMSAVRLERDLNKAWDIQRSLLPDHQLDFHDYQIFGVSIPDNVVGGDYFDYLTTDEDDERVGVIVSDAASKGLPAAIQALFVSGAIRMGIGFQTKITALISRLNALIYDTFPYERFVTLCYCEFTKSNNGLVLFANAGHCPPIHFSAQTKESSYLMPTGGILGIIEDQKFRVENINMQPGDVLLMFTDGILEAQNADGELYGNDRLIKFLERNHQLPPQEQAYLLIEEVEKFAVDSVYSDDKTLIVIKRLAPALSV